ncbi:MAG: polyprenol monophosphomannose synthase [Acidiferrobacterales bacterium]|jgi:dolichol-phosphate mannosyltransferase|nr:polyprenol monophosphomannose synthase [Acidiferrobacterales bacterium]
MRILVITPTYNEKENIEAIIEQVLAVNPGIEMLIVDDNSPDGTGDMVDRIVESNPRVHVLHRAGKLGLGTAYVEGFKKAIEMGVDCVVQMDADFSHHPSYLQSMLDKLDEADVVIGSRYMHGNISVVNWPLSRLMLSYFANIYARWVTGLPVYDVTGGFKAIKLKVLKSINLDRISSNGYAFQIEMNYIFNKKGFSIAEVPIIFADREGGVSKMSRKIVLEAVFKIWLYRFRKY